MKWLRLKWITLSACAVLLFSSYEIAHAVVVWNSFGLAGDVIDDNLIIDDSGPGIQLKPGSNIIRAITTNVNVNLINNPAVVRGNDGAPSQLYICADLNRTITVNIDIFNLSFIGSADAPQSPLLIVVAGYGTVIFNISGGLQLSFTRDATHGGTQVYQLMEIPAGGGVRPLLRFKKDNAINSGLNGTIHIGADSLISYLARMPVPFGLEQSVIEFDGSNANPAVGRLVLDIANTGAYIIAASRTNQVTKTLITLADIDRTTASGQNAITRITNSIGPTAHSSLLVLNRNEELFDLLIDPFGNLNAELDITNYKGSFSGERFGWVLGANAQLIIESDSYLDYVGLANNTCPVINNGSQFIKARNGSAFFVDGNHNPFSVPAQISMAARSGLFFRSGVDNTGRVKELTDPHPFSVTPLLQQQGAGDFVFDVEGLLNINGSNMGDTLLSKIELLSLEVAPTGGPLFLYGSETNFPIRTLDTDCGLYVSYNRAAFLINNCLNLINVGLAHTDDNHRVCEKDDVRSEPTYVGGDIARIDCFTDRPKIAFCNSRFLIHTDVAITGVDLRVSNKVDPVTTFCSSNLSKFIFFGNGRCVDKGTGRQMNLGTNIGSRACDGMTVVSPDAHLDIIPTGDCPNLTTDLSNDLQLTVSTNDGTLIPCIVDENISGQTSIHTIFLGNSSNISIGFDDSCVSGTNVVCSELLINGNFFSIETRGGPFGRPDLGGVTGQGVVFVDHKGSISIDSQSRAFMGAMVLKRDDGIVNLPKRQVLFGCRVGVTDWQLNLVNTTTVVPAGQCYSDYTINWRIACKDCDAFVPYEIPSVNLCDCPPVTTQNIAPLPTIAGVVEQLQIQGSRLGDQAHVVIDGGWVRELIFQHGVSSASAPTGVVILRNEGKVGIGSTHRNVDSLEASIVLGVNGVTIIADGSGEVFLNEDIIVNNVCAILKGPNFVSTSTAGEGDIIRINSDTERELRLKETGVLDLRTFSAGDVVELCGLVRMILEPGARILLNGVTLRAVDNACLIAEPNPKTIDFFNAIPLGPIDNTLNPLNTTPAADPHNQFAPLSGTGGVANTDEFRIKLIGTGTIELTERACFFIPRTTYVGVETLFEEVLDVQPTVTCQIRETDLSLVLRDSAQLIIGDLDTPGGSFQVGNTIERQDHSIIFRLNLEGNDAQAIVKSEGFMGLNVGIVDKRNPQPDGWLVDTLFNVNSIAINVVDGTFRHDRIFTGSSPLASLVALGQSGDTSPTFSLLLEPTPDEFQSRLSDANMQGGGNIALVTSSGLAGNAGAIAPIVGDQNDFIDLGGGFGNNPRLRVGILNSAEMLPDPTPQSVSPAIMFEYLIVKDFLDVNTTPVEGLGRATAAPEVPSFDEVRSPLRVGWVFADVIGRDDLYDLADALGGTMDDRRQRATDVGSVGIQLLSLDTPPGVFGFAQQLG